MLFRSTKDPLLVEDGKCGIISEGYLTINRNGVSTTKLFRRDKYAPVKRVTLEATQTEEEENPADSGGVFNNLQVQADSQP